MLHIQDILLDITEDIYAICVNHQIPCTLAGESVEDAVLCGGFSRGRTTQCIHIFASDIALVKKTIKKEYSQKYDIEDITTNLDLGSNRIRVMKKDSVLVDAKKTSTDGTPAIAVDIFPIYSKCPAKRGEALERGMMCMNMDPKDRKNLREDPVRERCFSRARREKIVLGKGVIARSVYRNISADQGRGDGGTVYIRRPDTEIVSMPAEWFQGYETENQESTLTFEGRLSIPLPADPEGYLMAWSGESKDDKTEHLFHPNQETDRMSVAEDTVRVIREGYERRKEFSPWDPKGEGADYILDDADMSCKEMMKAWKIGLNLSQFREDGVELMEWRKEAYEPAQNKADKAYAYVKRSELRINLCYYYNEIMVELKEAADLQDYNRLEQLMKPYLDAVDFCYRAGIGIFVSTILHEYACIVWKHKNMNKYAEDVLALVPEIYQNEEVSEFVKPYYRQ